MKVMLLLLLIFSAPDSVDKCHLQSRSLIVPQYRLLVSFSNHHWSAAIGTPLSNSITELHTMMRYLEYDFLNDHGLQHFDNWVAVVTHPKGQPFTIDEFPRNSAEVKGFCRLQEVC